MRTSLLLIFGLLALTLGVFLLPAFGMPQAVAAQGSTPPGQIFLPFLEKPVPPTPTPTPSPTATAAPQPRLTPTLPPSGNQWQLIEMRRLTPCENLGKHNIFIKVLDEAGDPVDGVHLALVPAGTTGPVLSRTVSGFKGPGLAEFDMWKNSYYAVYIVADAGSSQPASSDIAQPLHSSFTDEESCPDADGGNTLYHNSFSVIFRHGSPATPTPDPGVTFTPTSTPDPGVTATPTPSGAYEFNQATVVRCDPQAGGTWFSGTVFKHGQPANGYRVVFSWQPDGEWCTNPAISGPHDGYPYWNPGYYSHIIQSGSPTVGDWYVWIVNEAGVRISTMAQ